MRRRTRARELALQFLYSLEMRGAVAPDAHLGIDGLDDFLRQSGASRIARDFATSLVEGVLQRRSRLDTAIGAAATNWSLSRMPPVDRTILRLGAYELLFSRDVPVSVALNEAIELGKRYSTAQSGSFINGVLDRVKSERAHPAEPAGAPDLADEEEEVAADPDEEAR